MAAKRFNVKLLKKILVVLASMSLVFLCYLIGEGFHLGDEAYVGVFGLAATLVGTIFIAVELKNSQEVTCCETLINLNNYFHDNERLMAVYDALEKSYMKKDYSKEAFEGISDIDVACYSTFFENLYLLYHHHIARIEDLDDLFGYRFFIFTNNPYIQDHYLLPTSSSYVQIFQLYSAWIAYRNEENEDSDGQRVVAGAKYSFSDDYLGRRLYMVDSGICGDEATLGKVTGKDGEFVLKRAGFEENYDILTLQKRVWEAMPDQSIFYPLSREELIESQHLDHVVTVYGPAGELAAFAIVVDNRDSSRNLAADMGVPPSMAMTFDVVVVAPEFRGQGLQRALEDYALNLARSKGVKHILATVSPDNPFSLNNFLSKGYREVKELNKYADLRRKLLALEL